MSNPKGIDETDDVYETLEYRNPALPREAADALPLHPQVAADPLAAAFAERYPDIRVYRSHVSPYFKVTVGDFRTHADAQRFATRLTNSGAYQTAFVVKEQINYPGF